MTESQIRREFFKAIDIEFNNGWKLYSESVRERVLASNARIFKILKEIKGDQFVYDLRELSHTTGKSLIRLCKEQKGIKILDKRWSTIPEIWITGDGLTGAIYIQVRKNKWIYIKY